MPGQSERPGGSGRNGPKPSLVRVRVERIRCHGHSARQLPNPEYDRIRTSVRASGLDRPLTVTRDPDTRNYLLHGSGGTRLQVLKELFRETGQERFRWVDCIVRPWEGESGALLAHLRDNELRAGLTFIERALAVLDAKALLEKECGVGDLPPHRLEARFRERGLGLGEIMIARMIYAVEVLWPVMPQALSAGLGQAEVEEIRDLERASRKVWASQGLDDCGADEDADRIGFDTVFGALCRRHDCPEWDIRTLRDALEQEIARESNKVRSEIHLELDTWLYPRSFPCIHSQDPGDGGGPRQPDPERARPGQTPDEDEPE